VCGNSGATTDERCASVAAKGVGRILRADEFPPQSPFVTAAAPLRVAIGGRMQVGKTTAADRLAERHGFVKYALAAPIKEIARAEFGWDGEKDARGRRLLQEVGTVGRNYRGDIWLARFAERLDAEQPARAVVDDLRLEREEEYLRGLGFVCVVVTRPASLIPPVPGAEGARGHETETEIGRLDADVEIANAGTFEELYGRLDRLVADLEARRS
jgi:dephospho-CoA kinase